MRHVVALMAFGPIVFVLGILVARAVIGDGASDAYLVFWMSVAVAVALEIAGLIQWHRKVYG